MRKNISVVPESYTHLMGRGTSPQEVRSPQMRLTLSRKRTDLGADDYESGLGVGYLIIARRGDKQLGHITYSVREDHMRIIWVEVNNDARHQGVGSALITELLQQHPDLSLTTGGFTDDGHAFFDKLGIPIEEERDPLREDEE